MSPPEQRHGLELAAEHGSVLAAGLRQVVFVGFNGVCEVQPRVAGFMRRVCRAMSLLKTCGCRKPHPLNGW